MTPPDPSRYTSLVVPLAPKTQTVIVHVPGQSPIIVSLERPRRVRIDAPASYRIVVPSRTH